MIDIVTFDVEIKNKILNKGEKPDPVFNYCEGWRDFEGMGVSFLGAHTSKDDKLQFFDEYNLKDFLDLLAEADIITGYNILAFDIPLLKVALKKAGVTTLPDTTRKVYDIFYDVRKNKVGYPWDLNTVAKNTLGISKSGDGALAPDLWQLGRYAELINYLAQDVRIESGLFQHVYKHGWASNGIHRINLTEIAKFSGSNKNVELEELLS